MVHLTENESAFDLLYCITFKLMDDQWLAMRASYMDFNVSFLFRNYLDSSSFQSLRVVDVVMKQISQVAWTFCLFWQIKGPFSQLNAGVAHGLLGDQKYCFIWVIWRSCSRKISPGVCSSLVIKTIKLGPRLLLQYNFFLNSQKTYWTRYSRGLNLSTSRIFGPLTRPFEASCQPCIQNQNSKVNCPLTSLTLLSNKREKPKTTHHLSTVILYSYPKNFLELL